MNSLVSLLLFTQALGAFVGAVSAVWSEFAYVRALQDGRLDKPERAHLNSLGRGLRFGMSLLLLSSLGLVISAYARGDSPQPALTESYWMLVVLALLILLVSWALSRQYLSLAVGSAVSFTAWWFLVYLTTGRLPVSTAGTTVVLFLVAAALVFALLKGGRHINTRKR